MKLFYITLNNEQEAKTISQTLLEKKIAVCTNWFPIQCAYQWEGKINFGNEIVLIIKTIENKRQQIETIIAQVINYTNFIAEIEVKSVNTAFQAWLDISVTADTNAHSAE
jgi:periplasmic divalent cation tolerance protein